MYAAFAAPAVLARWWGPDGFTNEFETFEFVPGGRWRFVMQGPDGTRYANENRFNALEPDARIVIEHRSAPHFVLTITLAPVAGGTRLTWDQAFDDAATAAAVRSVVVPSNEQNLDRLQRVLAAG